MQVAGLVLMLAGLAASAAGAVVMSKWTLAGRAIIVTGATSALAGMILTFAAGIFPAN